jgi:hypothetical protein
MSIRLRDYVYLDDALVERLLSQVERGVADEEEQTDVEKTDKRRGAGLKVAPARAEMDRNATTEASSSRTVRQTADSACSRLIETLEAADSLQFLEAFDDDIWCQLRRGEALEIDVSVELSALSQLGGIATAIEPMAAIMSGAGQDVDQQSMEMIKAFSALSGLLKAVPVLARPTGASGYTFIANLKPDALRVDQTQLSGEAVIFGTLERRLRPDESWSILDAMGLAGLPRSVREQMGQSLAESESAELGEMVVKPPAALLNPIAIYH